MRILHIVNKSHGIKATGRRHLSAAFAFLLVTFSMQINASENNYTIGIVPQFEAKRLYEIWQPVLSELETRTGYHFTIEGSSNIPDFEHGLYAGKFDFAYMNPYHYIKSHKNVGYIPLIRDIGRTLQGVLVVNKNGDIKNIKDLDNKVVSFPSPNALGASLQIRQELADLFKINIIPKYVQTHDSVYLNVALRQTSAGGGIEKTLSKQKKEIQDSLIILHHTTPVSPHPIAAHPRIPENVRIRVIEQLLAIGESPAGQELLKLIPINKIGPATNDDYIAVDNMHLERFVSAE